MQGVMKRIEELRSELAKGRQHLDALDQERQEVRDTMLRISGAIQALEELLKQNNSALSKPDA